MGQYRGGSARQALTRRPGDKPRGVRERGAASRLASGYVPKLALPRPAPRPAPVSSSPAQRAATGSPAAPHAAARAPPQERRRAAARSAASRSSISEYAPTFMLPKESLRVFDWSALEMPMFAQICGRGAPARRVRSSEPRGV